MSACGGLTIETLSKEQIIILSVWIFSYVGTGIFPVGKKIASLPPTSLRSIIRTYVSRGRGSTKLVSTSRLSTHHNCNANREGKGSKGRKIVGMERIRWLSCVLLVLARGSSHAASFVCHPPAAHAKQHCKLRTPHVLLQCDENRQLQKDAIQPITNDFQMMRFVALLLPVATLAVPLVAAAIDHPVDHATLGIPIPVPDVRYFLAGGLCAAASHGITTPIDVVKTRIQADPDKFNQGLVSATRTILQEDGPGALLGGLGPTVVGYGVEGAMKFGLYESLKPTFAQFLPSNDVAAAYLGASIVAGAVASLLLCPMERTRIRLVTDPTFATGLVSTESF